MDIPRRSRRGSTGSSETGTAKDGTKSSKETVPETGRSVTDRGLDFGTKERWKIARPLTEKGASFGTRMSRISNQVLFDGSDLMKERAHNYPVTPSKYKFEQETEPLEPSGQSRVPKSFDATRDQSSKDGFDDFAFKRGAALDYPEIPGEAHRTTGLIKKLDRNSTDRDYHSDNEEKESAHLSWSSIDFPKVPGEGHTDADGTCPNVISRYTRNVIRKIGQEASTLDGSTAGSASSSPVPTSIHELDEHPSSGESYSAHRESKNHLTIPGEDLIRLQSRLPTHTGSLGQQDSDKVMHKASENYIDEEDSAGYTLLQCAEMAGRADMAALLLQHFPDINNYTPAHQAGILSVVGVSGAQASSLYQKFDDIPSKTPKGDAGDSTNEFAVLSSPYSGIGGISSESLAEAASVSEYLTKLVDQGSKSFIFEEDPDWQTIARRVEKPENGTSSFLRNLSPSTWERFKQIHPQNEAYLKASQRFKQLQGENALYLIGQFMGKLGLEAAEPEGINGKQSAAFNIGHTMGSRERKREEDELSDISNVSAASSIPSVADSIFTMVSGSSRSSVSAPEGAGERLVGLLLGDVIIKQACSEALLTIEEERFERNLRRLLRDFSSELRKEAETVQQRHAANFVRFRARNFAHIICNFLKPGRKPRVDNEPEEESENEDSDRSEDEVENLEIFIKSSKAFDSFRTKLRAFVYPSEQKANDIRPKTGDGNNGHNDEDIGLKAPTQDEIQVDNIENVVDEDLPKVDSVVKAFNAVIDTIWMPLRNTPPLVPLGKIRVEWQCKCGQTIYDDFIELKPGAAEKFKETLTQMSKSTASSNSSRVSSFASTFPTSLKSFSSLFSISNTASENSLPFHQRHLPSNATSEATPIPQDPNAPLPEPQYLPICYRDGRYATRLMQPDLIDQHVNSDRALFDLLRSSYQGTRGNWTSLFSLQTLSWIKFVQFELYHGELVDVRKVNDMPPLEHVDYRYAPAPPDVLPPIGDMQMMHLFQNPSCAANSPWLMERFPKKLLRPLTCASEASANPLTPGWGIQFLVSWDIPKIWLISFFFFGFGSALIGILWCVFKHSIQDAFAIAAYVVAFGTVSVGSVQALLVM